MAHGTTARMRRGAEATWQSRGWPTRGAGGTQGAATWQGATRPHGSMWAPVWGATWQRVGRWRADGIMGLGKIVGAVTQMRYHTLIFKHVIFKYFFRVGLCSHTIHFCRLRGSREIVGCGRDDDDRVDPSPRDHKWNTCEKY